MENILHLKNVTKSFGSKTILKNITFSISKGEIVGLLGANGAGKSTCMKLISGLYKPTNGDIQLLNVQPFSNWNKIYQQVGILFEPAIPSDLTGIEFLKQIAILQNNKQQDLLALLKTCGLKNAAKQKVKEYSFGMKQRLGLAAALIGNPQFLMLDEPFVGLDPLGIEELRQLLKTLAKNGTAIFISSHQLHELEGLVSRVLFIKNGSIQFETTEINATSLRAMFEMEETTCVNS